jgi:hypothetical protein
MEAEDAALVRGADAALDAEPDLEKWKVGDLILVFLKKLNTF